ncbi:MAG: DNA-binding domain-containing protein [Steroidobacteraceae bacterium]
MARLADRQRDFAAALLNTDQLAPAGLVGPDGEQSALRFSVYRNNVFVGLSAALRASFPCVARLVGDEFFAAMARDFVTVRPPASPVLLHYGAEFADFVGSFAPAASVPYLADVARIERAATEAYHARDEIPLTLAALAAVPHDQSPSLRLKLHPSLRLVRSVFPAFTIWRMNTKGGTPEPVDLSEAQIAMILRADAEVDIRPASSGSHAFLVALGSGLTLSQALTNALAADSQFDLAGNLQELIQRGAFVGFDLSVAESEGE